MNLKFLKIKKNTLPYLLFGITILSAIPFIVIELFHNTLYTVMDVPSYLLFHNIAEFFSVMVSFSIFGIGWYSFHQSKDKHALFLSLSFLLIGFIDFSHTLGYTGMPDLITVNSPNKSTQFWVIARNFSGLLLLASAFIYPNSYSKLLTKSVLLTITISLSIFIFLAITFYQSELPRTYIVGIGLTPLKKYAEYFSIFLYFLCFIAYFRRFQLTFNKTIIYFLSAFIVSIFSELVFVGYQSVFDTYNVLGHIYKIIAYYLIYNGIFVATINLPYNKLRKVNQKINGEISRHLIAKENLSKSLREKETLIKELYHRTKNTLQLIRSMVHIQAGQLEPNKDIDTLISKTDERIQSISLVHQMLYNSKDLSKINIKEYIMELTILIKKSFIINEDQIQIEMIVEEHNLLLDTAIPFGLILTELLTNSLKYAFPFNQKGKISIMLKMLGNTLHFSYKDNGVGFKMEKQEIDSSSLGLKLVETLAKEQMHGNFQMNSHPGFNFEFEFATDLYQARV
ncbi:MAG: MASE3 domain-containing protein [Leptospira sp.]|nr:MASE3 domain-containing protein [Leptospira sp.]